MGPTDCLGTSYRLGAGVHGGYALVGTVLAVQASARFHGASIGPYCVNGFPPPDGTYVVDDYRNLTADRFALTDLGIRATAAGGGAGGTVALAAGKAWRPGRDSPYVRASARVFLQVRSVRFLLGAELYRLRLRFDRFERTWQNFEMVTNVPLGTFHEWNSAVIVTLGLEVPFGR